MPQVGQHTSPACECLAAWLEEARRSFERAFAKKDSEGPMTFSQIEELAVQEGQRVARFLLEKKLARPGRCGSAVGVRPFVD